MFVYTEVFASIYVWDWLPSKWMHVLRTEKECGRGRERERDREGIPCNWVCMFGRIARKKKFSVGMLPFEPSSDMCVRILWTMNANGSECPRTVKSRKSSRVGDFDILWTDFHSDYNFCLACSRVNAVTIWPTFVLAKWQFCLVAWPCAKTIPDVNVNNEKGFELFYSHFIFLRRVCTFSNCWAATATEQICHSLRCFTIISSHFVW